MAAKFMSASLNELLKNKTINGWNLFWLIATPISIAIVFTMTRVDLSSAEGVSSMIQLSVRCAVPWLFLAFAASSLQVVFPGPFSRWLLRNRKFIGLCFAAAMAWQLTFILWLVGIHTEYYVNDVYVLSDVLEGVVGYAFLIAMVLTSFKFGRSLFSPKQWKLLHTSGIYWLWVYAWSVYWFNLFYYESPAVLIDYVYYWGGLLAWSLRMLAWTKKRRKQAEAQSTTGGTGNLLFIVAGVVAVVIGLTGSSFGSAWSPQVYEFLFGFGIVESVDAFMPYFPLVPFYPIFIVMSGAFLIIRSRD
jgi:hypothetical protein